MSKAILDWKVKTTREIGYLRDHTLVVNFRIVRIPSTEEAPKTHLVPHVSLLLVPSLHREESPSWTIYLEPGWASTVLTFLRLCMKLRSTSPTFVPCNPLYSLDSVVPLAEITFLNPCNRR